MQEALNLALNLCERELVVTKDKLRSIQTFLVVF